MPGCVPIWPDVLPCGCRLKNSQGAMILTHHETLRDGTKVCDHDKRWKVEVRVVEIRKGEVVYPPTPRKVRRRTGMPDGWDRGLKAGELPPS